jgi:hypothetical protein
MESLGALQTGVQQLEQAVAKDQAADHGGGNAGQQNGSRGNVEGVAHTGARPLVKAPADCLDGTVKKFSSQDHAGTPDENAPITQVAPQGDTGGQHQGSEEKVNGEAGMTADAQLQAAESIAELVAPATPWPAEGCGIGTLRYRGKRRRREHVIEP